MNKKEQYEAPLVECYEIKLERRPLMQSNPKAGNPGEAGSTDSINNYGDGLI